MAEVSRGRSSCASSEGPNGPRKGIKGAMSTRRDSTTDKRPKSQYRLAFPEESRGAAPMAFAGGTESELAERKAESPTSEQWMEEVCERENCKQALRRVKANKGRGAGTERSQNTAMGFGPNDRHIRQWRRHSNIKPKATAGWWIWISRNFSTGSITTDY